MPTLLLLAREGFGRDADFAEPARKYVAQLEEIVLPGGHHFHMEPCVDTVAQQIDRFLQG